jgi:threonine/homoserine/homoserine lactone efflux protein
LLTLSNPVTIMFFSAVYAGLTVDGSGLADSVSAGFIFFAVGVFAGSLSWWMILVSFVNAVRQRFNFNQLRWLNRVSGLLIAGFGVWVLVRQILA